MKKLFIALSLSTLMQSSFAQIDQLDGKKFCRNVQTRGMFGQVPVMEHCLIFDNGKVIDVNNAKFGTPPEIYSYELENLIIINLDKQEETSYELRDDKIGLRGTEIVFSLK